jgi:exonuclease I
VLNTDKDRYLNYETSINGDLIGNVCVRCHDSEKLYFFGLAKPFNIAQGGYARVRAPEMIVLKENANLKITIDEDGHLLANGSGNTLPIDRSYSHRSGITIQMKAKGKRKANCCTNVINHILSTCQNCYLCKHNVRIDSEVSSKIKRTLVDNITNEYKDDLIEK